MIMQSLVPLGFFRGSLIRFYFPTLLHARKLDESTVHLILRDAVKLAHVDVLCDTAVPR